MDLDGGEKILRSDQKVKVAGDQVSSEEKQAHIDEIKAICFLLITDQNRYSFLLKKPRDRENIERDEYLATTISELEPLIHTVGGIRENHK